MDAPLLLDPRAVSRDTDVIPAYVPIAALGLVPVSSFVVRARQPLLVDCGIVALGDAFFDRIRARVDPADLRWIVLTHADPDHVGCLEQLLVAAPRATLVTSFLAVAKLGLLGVPIDPARLVIVQPGQTIDVGDRRLVALPPPVFDAPDSVAFFDVSTRILFSADTFGALLEAPAETANDVPPEALARGITTWAHVDAPWLSHTDPAAFARALELYRRLAPSAILSCHLPPASRMTERLLGLLESARTAAPPPTAPDVESLVDAIVKAASAPRPVASAPPA